jgi:hypothetical protein
MSEDRINQLEEEIKNKQYELEILKADVLKTKFFYSLDELSDADKIERFDKMFEFAKSLIDDAQEQNHWRDENDTHALESMFENTIVKNKSKFWDYFNEEINF